MPTVNIAQATKRPQIRDPIAIRREQRGVAALRNAQGRMAQQDADFYERTGTSEAGISARETARNQQLQAQQERRLQTQQLYQQANKRFLDIAEYASNIAANQGDVPENMRRMMRTTAEQALHPFAAHMNEQRIQEYVQGGDPSKIPSYNDLQQQYRSILDMAIAEGRTRHQADQMEDGDSKLDIYNDLYSQTQSAGAQAAVRNAEGQIRILSDVTNLFGQMLADDQIPSSVTGAQGAVLGFVGQVKDAINAGFDYAANIVDGEGNILNRGAPDTDLEIKSLRNQDPVIKEALDDLDRKLEDTIPGAEERARYRSAVVEAAFALARAREPGNPRLSNQDLALAMESLGADLGNPKAMLTTFIDVISRDLGQLKLQANQAYTRGEHEAVGLSRDDINKLHFGVNDLDKTLGAADRARTRANQLIRDARGGDLPPLPKGLDEETVRYNMRQHGKTRQEVIDRWMELQGNQ